MFFVCFIHRANDFLHNINHKHRPIQLNKLRAFISIEFVYFYFINFLHILLSKTELCWFVNLKLNQHQNRYKAHHLAKGRCIKSENVIVIESFTVFELFIFMSVFHFDGHWISTRLFNYSKWFWSFSETVTPPLCFNSSMTIFFLIFINFLNNIDNFSNIFWWIGWLKSAHWNKWFFIIKLKLMSYRPLT